nr:hypothetical protein [Myxococcota bacterium]
GPSIGGAARTSASARAPVEARVAGSGADSPMHAEGTLANVAEGRALIELEPVQLASRTVAEVLVDRATVSRARGNFLEAETDYLGAVRREPDSERAIAGLVRLYIARPDARLALQWARRLVEVDPTDPDHHVLLGDVFELGGDPRRARRARRRATALRAAAATTP